MGPPEMFGFILTILGIIIGCNIPLSKSYFIFVIIGGVLIFYSFVFCGFKIMELLDIPPTGDGDHMVLTVYIYALPGLCATILIIIRAMIVYGFVFQLMAIVAIMFLIYIIYHTKCTRSRIKNQHKGQRITVKMKKSKSENNKKREKQ
eukprot:255542_1